MKLPFMCSVMAVFLSTLPTPHVVVHVFLFTNSHIARLSGETDSGGQDRKTRMEHVLLFLSQESGPK